MTSLDLSNVYQIGVSEKVRELEEELNHELAELRTELEEVDLPPKTTSSIPIPEKKEHFQQERKFAIQRALEVSVAKPVCIQADQMKTEMATTEQNEYTSGSLPLLLLQHFTERIQHLVHLKHQYMLRWRRFCGHTSVMEALYPIYNERLIHILDEYKDCVQRAQRLSIAREALMLDKPESAVTAVNVEDLLIYLRWLVCHLHSIKRFNQFLKVLQWLPTTHKTEIVPPDAHEEAGRSQATTARSEAGSALSNLTSTPSNPKLMSITPLPTYAVTASGGTLASDEHLSGIPIHSIDLESFRPQLALLIGVYGINFDLSSVRNSSDEMEMFGIVNNRFKQIFSKQEHLLHFRTYDRFEPGKEPSELDHTMETLKKEATWCDFIHLHAETDVQEEKMRSELQQRKYVDEILNVQAHFVKVNNFKNVQATLKQHAAHVQNPQPVLAASVTSHRTPNNTTMTWKKIYSNPDLYTETNENEAVSVSDVEDRKGENVNFGASSSRDDSSHKRKDSYDYLSTVQMLGLDDADKEKADVMTTLGAYLSYLHLRHLRIRDMQRNCLSVLNYFRSVERTLTINDQGLCSDGDSLRTSSFQNHHVGTDIDGGAGGGGGLGFHGYMHNTPADFKMSESDFIEFSEVTNHDDFYVIEDGRVNVLDQKGYHIMYDKALEDLRSLEADLLHVCSHYIEKDRDLRSTVKSQSSGSARAPLNQAGDFDIPRYAHQDVDRFEVLLDVWSNEASFLDCKREVMDCYFEAYQHVVDRDERRRLAQIITNIMHKRPRFDPQSDYFVRTYWAECSVLRKHAALVKAVLDRQIENEREYIQRVTREGDRDIGLPHKVIQKQPIAVNLSRPALKNVYILEFHPSLAIASRIPTALDHAYWELHEIHQPATLLAALLMEAKLLQVALREWESLPMLGSSFSMQVQKDLFSDTFAEDPVFQCQLALNSVKQNEDGATGRRSHKEKHLSMVETIGRLLNIVTLRHRMIEACWETEILSKIYKDQASEMGFPEFHLFLRFVQFEFASFKEEAGKPPPIFITTVQEDDAAVDKYLPSCLYLAVHELDEGHVGRFSFRSCDSMLQIMRPGGMENIQVVLKVQVAHKNALIAAVQQVCVCNPVKVTEWKSGRASPTETKSEKSSLTQMTSTSGTTSGNLVTGTTTTNKNNIKRTVVAESFFSLQLEKMPSRDLMLNDFVAKKQQLSTILKNSDEMERVKRILISEFCERFHLRLSQTSMRGQLLAYYTSMMNLLSKYPRVRETYFVVGEPNEKKTNEDDLEGLTVDPRMMKKRPRRLLSSDGRHVLNLWFIPHYSEVLFLFKTLDEGVCNKALTYSLSIVGALHDILHYLTAISNLGSSHIKLESVSASWGSTEAIGSELREIQKQIQHLRDPTDPELVVELLNLRRDVMYLAYEMSVRNCMADTFLSIGNAGAYKSIMNNAQYALTSISNVQRPSLLSTHLTIPEPLEARDLSARCLFSWRAFINCNGPYPVALSQWFRIESFMKLCLAGLKDVDRHVASGEILGVNLLLEDVLRTGLSGLTLTHDLESQSHGQSRNHSQSVTRGEAIESVPVASNQVVTSDVKETGSILGRSHQQCIHSVAAVKISDIILRIVKVFMQVSRVCLVSINPLESNRLLKFFLQLWKCLFRLQLDWGKKKLSVEHFDNPTIYREFCKLYRTEILLPTLQSVARRLGQGDLYDHLVLDTDVIVMPQGASETEVRFKQLHRLLEILECHMIMEVRKRVSRELTLAVAERAREEEVLPTDLWKRAVMKESLTLNRPHIAEKFVDLLMSEVNEDTDTSVTFDSKHLQSCLSELARSIMLRERHNFGSFSMYYENMLRSHHQLLFQKEQETKHLMNQLKQVQNSIKISVQCQLADDAHDLLMEVTALRAKVAEMRELSLTQERDIRERVKEEYEDLIYNIFNSTFLLRSKFDEFRTDLQDHVMDKVTETRREAVDALSKLQLKFTGTLDKEKLQVDLEEADLMKSLLHENNLLSKALLKVKAINTWRQNIKTQNFIKTASDLHKKVDSSKKDHLEVQMLAEEEVVLLRQQLVAIRKALTATETDCSQVRQLLQREMKIKAEKQHEEAERKRSKQQLEGVKQASMDKLIGELMDRDIKLRKLEVDYDKTNKQTLMEYEKAKRELDTLKKQSSRERNLKLGAFQRVDVLQSQVYDLETCLVSRPQSQGALSMTKQRSRSTSAQTSRRSRPSTGGNQWQPVTKWSVNRSITPFGEFPCEDTSTFLNNNGLKIMDRPKTVGSGRVRGRIAELLLSELESDTKTRLLSK